MSRLLFLGTSFDSPYLPRLKSCTNGASIQVILSPVSTLIQIELLCKQKQITGVFFTQVSILEKLLQWTDTRKKPSLDNYQGSIFTHGGIEWMPVSPLEQLVSVPYGSFILRRFISKLANPKSWLDDIPFNYTLADPSNIDSVFNRFSSAFAIAVDIETFSNPISIRCIGYSALFISATGELSIESYVIPITDLWALSWMRRFNWELKAPKIFQNGKYDNAYLAAYDSCAYNWLYDTITFFHCWYSELPKDLAFITAFTVRKSMYWKDLANTGNLDDYYRYNALDTANTLKAWIGMMIEIPEYARVNYLMEFRVNFPCHLAEMTGLKRDMARLESSAAKYESEILEDETSLGVMTATPGFNVNSAPQMKALMKTLGLGVVDSCDEKHLEVYALRHPLNSRLVKKILTIREKRKLKSTYLTTGEKAKEYNGTILYAINPHGTDTGRCASKEHHFWCGLQLQNIPRGDAVKSTIRANDGFRFFEVDLEQAESRNTAYAAGETKLIAAVESPKDFHSTNASAFFGVPYDKIYSDTLKKAIDKALRDLAKRVNHGANYLMGESVLVATMGEEKVWEAKRLLGLPKSFGLMDVARHLLRAFHATYPGLEGTFYPWVVSEVVTHNKLVGAHGWTRYCFGDPAKNKRNKNAYVAHVAQGENAQTVNKSQMAVFYDIAIHPTHRYNFRYNGQIHDSTLGQVRDGHEYLVERVRERMEIPLTIRGADGITRTFTVPAAAKMGIKGPDGQIVPARYWNETE